MSVYGMMRASVTGLSAQASKLGAVGDNIANSDTVGYKRASTEFSSLVLHSHGGQYTPGGVRSEVRNEISRQGSLSFTTSDTDLAISGEGFFLVADLNGAVSMTRAGAFIIDQNYDLVNAAGQKLLGYPSGGNGGVVNGTTGLEPINLEALSQTASPSDEGQYWANLPADAAVVAAADLPSANAATATPTAKSSVISYDNLGREVILDIYSAKTGPEAWELAVFNRADADPAGGFPYASGPLVTQNVTFDATTGQLAASSPTEMTIAIPSGAPLVMDLSSLSQLATEYSVIQVEVDGNAPSDRSIAIGGDGTLYAISSNGSRVPTYRIPLGTVASIDQLTPVSGTMYQLNAESGDMQIGFAGESGLGNIISGAVEESTVDLATELTTMIEAQRNYTANTKVFQTGSELLDVLINLKR